MVSGSLAALDKLEEIGRERGGIRATRLSVAGAFHTDIMRPADTTLAEALAAVTIHTPRIPVWSNVDAQPHTE